MTSGKTLIGKFQFSRSWQSELSNRVQETGDARIERTKERSEELYPEQGSHRDNKDLETKSFRANSDLGLVSDTFILVAKIKADEEESQVEKQQHPP